MKLKLFPLLLACLLTSCSTSKPYVENEVFCFDTAIISRLYEEGDNSNLEDIKKILLKYDAYSDNYHVRDNISVGWINEDPIVLEPEFYNLLKTSVEVSNEGATYFNPLCGSLAKAWKNSLEKSEVLSNEIIASELEKINSSKINFFDDNYVSKTGDAEIDLGGIVKGYALDKVYDYLKEHNLKKYLINAGRSSILLGEKNVHDGYFKILIGDAGNKYLNLKNCFLSTSSISEQGVTINEVTYSHIINPKNGSAINEQDCVIVVSSKGYIGDALSTSMMLNTVDEIKEIEKAQDVKCVVIKNHKIVYVNEGLEIIDG